MQYELSFKHCPVDEIIKLIFNNWKCQTLWLTKEKEQPCNIFFSHQPAMQTDPWISSILEHTLYQTLG